MEVKGITAVAVGDVAPPVFVTKNEVNCASNHPEKSWLVIVSNISVEVRQDGTVQAPVVNL